MVLSLYIDFSLWLVWGEALLLVQINPCEEQPHGQQDEDCDLELVREEDGADDGGEHVGRGRAVLLHHDVQLLQDGGHHQPPHTAEQEAEHHKDLDLGVGGLEVGEDEARTEVRTGDDVDQTGHQHPVQIQPELLLQEILTRILNYNISISSMENLGTVSNEW